MTRVSTLLLLAGWTALGAAPLPEAERLAAIATRVEASCRSFEQGLAGPDPQPSVRQLTACALGWLELGQEPARAEKLVRHAFGLQVMDPASPGYGTVPWQEGHPEIKDPNAIEFTMQPVGVILLRHGGKLSGSFKQDAEPHVRAAITAIRRHNVPVKYSNIYLMKLVNLLLLGQAIGDGAAVAEGRANFETWLAFTRTNGVTEYDSPTYTPIQAACLELAHNLTSDPALKARLNAALDFYWADLAANYFAGRQTLTGPASRDYSFLFSDPNVDYAYYLAGLRSRPPADTYLCDAVRTWTAARMNGYRPPPDILALADSPDRTVRSKFGAAPGQDRYVWLTPTFTIGSASAYYGPQDKRICAELASDKQLPLISLVVDALDAPFGLVRSTDPGGHSKPHHLPHLLATVQEKGFLLALIDVSPAIQSGEFTNLASNIILPVRADQLVLNGNRVDPSKPFALPADVNAVVGVREGKAVVMARLFAADGCAGQAPSWKLEFDGNEQGAGRLAVYHYRGPARKLAEPSVRCGLLLLAARCETEAEFSALLKRAAHVELVESTQNGVWEVKAKSGAVELQAGLDLSRKQIAFRRVNGRAWQPEVLSVNGRDLAAETLGRVTGNVSLEQLDERRNETQAAVTIDTAARSVAYSPMIFGGFLEHFDHQIYGGVFEPGSPLSDKRGFRKDVIAALRELKCPVVRWPGGCYASGYHWEAGVGKQRRPTDDMAWGVVEPNIFGTDEFIELCRLTGWQPYICNNAGNGTIEEMRNWVEYCNASEGAYARMRKDSGYAKPRNVNLWSIGNENWGAHEIGYKPIEQWAPLVLAAAKAMKAADPNIQLTAAALPTREWTLPLLKMAGQYLEYISIHSYWLPLWGKNHMPDYLTCIMHSESPEQLLANYIGVLEDSGYRGHIKIAFDEWNLRGWHHEGFPRKAVQDYSNPEVIRLIAAREKNDIASQYTMADALFSASFLNACLRHAEDVGMANIAPLVNTRGPLYVHPQGIVKRAHFHTLAMYANELKNRVGKLEIQADPLTHNGKSVPVVDAVATVNESGKHWAIVLVNRHAEKTVACTVRMKDQPLHGSYQAIALTGDSPDAYNDIEKPSRVVPKNTKLTFTRGRANLPPHSLTIVKIVL